MNSEKKELIKYRLMRAREALDDAKILLDNNRLFSSVNRIYYAMFYAVSSLLLTDTSNFAILLNERSISLIY